MDKLFITSVTRGDHAALTYLLNNFRSNAYAIAFKFVKERPEAEDVVQEALSKFF